jgi:hypothetical protein
MAGLVLAAFIMFLRGIYYSLIRTSDAGYRQAIDTVLAASPARIGGDEVMRLVMNLLVWVPVLGFVILLLMEG